MSYMMDGYYTDTVANAQPSVRGAFYRRTYATLAGAVAAFVAVEAALLTTGLGRPVLETIMGLGGLGWIALMVAFMGASYAAQAMARSNSGPGVQFAGLSLYVLAEAVIFLPILTLATYHPMFAGKGLVLQAGVLTLLAFGGLTLGVFVTGKDFSFLGPIIGVVSLLMLGAIVLAVIFGAGSLMTIGISVVGVALASAAILYTTSNIIHYYRPDQHVAAALELFAAVALLFFYILKLLMMSRSNN